jgi:hypothetical protein
MYKPVAFRPFNALETPSLSKIAEMSGNNMPWENPEIETIMTRIQNLRCSALDDMVISKTPLNYSKIIYHVQ